MNERLYNVKDLPVKLFINCKNSKRKAPPSVKFPKRNIGSGAGADDKGSLEGEDFDLYEAAEEAISREEVYFTGKENIEGFACLVNVFIRQLSVTIDNVALINVDNHEDDFEK